MILTFPYNWLVMLTVSCHGRRYRATDSVCIEIPVEGGAQLQYAQIDKEALATVWGVKKFHNYLFGRNFTLLTDHEPLTSIFHTSKSLPAVTAARLQRYALFLAGFDYTIRYKNTKLHGNADGLSRLPLHSETTEEEPDPVDLFYATQFEPLPVTAEQVKRETQRDPLLVKVHELVMKG